MNNYLLQLLKEIKTIIIPGLGALTLTNEATGEMMFMPYLKYDDGTLAKHISEKEGMDLNDAKNLIAKFVREVTAELDKGHSYDMYQFGSFKKVDGDVAFEQWSAGAADAADAAENSGVSVPEPQKAIEPEPQPEQPVPVPAPEPVIPEKPEAPIAETIPVQEPVPTSEPLAAPPREEPKTPENAPAVEAPVTPDPREMAAASEVAAEILPTIEEKKTVPAPEPDNETILPEKNTAPSTPEQEMIAASGVAAETTAPKELSPKEKLAAADRAKKAAKQPKPAKPDKKAQPAGQAAPKKKRRAIGYILWGFIVLLLGGATYVAVNFESLKQDFPILADLAGDNNEKAVGDDDITTVVEEEDTTGTNADAIPELNPEDVAPNPLPDEAPIETSEPVEEPKPVKTEKPKPVEKPVTKPVSKPKPASSTTKPKPKPRPSGGSGTIGSPDPSRPYHVIGGSFGSEGNARKFARELIAKGQPSVVVGEFNGMYRVSVASFATKDEAVRANNELQGVVASTWVFRWP